MINQDKIFEKNALKPFLKLEIGSKVFLISDTEKKYPMIITDFDLNDYWTNDYWVKWFDSKGIIQSSCFPEECLTTEINNQ